MIYLRLSINQEETYLNHGLQKIIDVIPNDIFYVESIASFYKSGSIDLVIDSFDGWLRAICETLANGFKGRPKNINPQSFLKEKLVLAIECLAVFLISTLVVCGVFSWHFLQSGVFSLLLALLLLFYRTSRRPLSKIRIYFIQPGERFPDVDSQFVNDSVSHVYAIRLLSKNSNLKYRPEALRNANYERSNFLTKKLSLDRRVFRSIDQVERRNRELTRFETDVLPDYWALLYFSLARQIDSKDGLRLGEVFRFSALLNRNRVLFLLFLVLTLVTLSSFGLLVLAAESLERLTEVQMAAKQGTLYMSFLAIVWAIYSIVNYRQDLDHVITWERTCKRKPFMHCPVFKAEPTKTTGIEWALVDGATFGTPMASFGLDGERFLQVVLATIVIVFIMMVQLVK